MEFNFKGKKVIVTGGGSGLGRECALLFAKSGADVLIADLKPERCEQVAQEIKNFGVKSISFAVDVTKYDQVAEMYKKIVSEWGTVDFVVNSAGVCLTEDLTKQELKDIDLSIDVNIKGTIYSCREALSIMRPKKYGKIVNMSSIAAKACLGGFSVYSATKSAVLAATACLGREAAKDNVTVNCILPGIIKTNMWEEILDQLAGEDQAKRDEVWNAWNAGTPNGKPQDPIDIANMVAFLCSEEARYITAQNIGVDGGYTF
ncbi:MAG: SDR family oxidoreductase [Clostridium sp.]|nr:SDR family oxidoreductase [Clostridium sp.]MCM1443757.1 SDR family oxidoreductase [Candidatus Amulumruptor caecigallinarius]